MRRLPSKPQHIRQQEANEWVRRSRRRRFIVDCILLISIAVFFIPVFFNHLFMNVMNDFTARFNGLECELSFVDTDNGYSIFLECEGRTALIDSGNEGHSDEIIRYLEENEVEKLEYYFVLDATEEYKSVFETLLNSVEIQSIVLPADEIDNRLTGDYDETAFMNGKTAIILNEGRAFNVHRMLVNVIDPQSSSFEIRFGNHSFVIWNSYDESAEADFVESFYEENTYVLWLGKHANQGEKILETFTPQICIVDSENKNHDTNFIEQYVEELYLTSNGEKIIVSSNEVDFDIKVENQ